MSKKKTNEEFKKEVHDLVENEYTVLGEYINNSTKIKIKHNKCDYEYEVRPRDFLQGYRCPKCNESKGEKIISKWLDKNLIKYEKEKKFPDCKYKKELRFDFYLEDYNICIEYDGIQHFRPKSFGGQNKDKEFKLTQIRDNIKTKYCEDNNIKLIRIKYTDYDNIEKILNKLI